MIKKYTNVFNIFDSKKSPRATYKTADIYTEMRNMVLSMKPAEIGLTATDANPVWGILMETGYEEAVATLVAIADGTVSLYFSNGGGIIGAGEHDAPREANLAFLADAELYLKYAHPTNRFPLPRRGYTRFYFLTYKGIFTVEKVENELGNEQLPLSPLFMKGHEVIAQARFTQQEIDEKSQELLHAAATGNIKLLGKIIQDGADPNTADATGLTPLMAAAHEGQDKAVKILLRLKCSIDAQDEAGYTALIFASNQGQTNAARSLIASGADVNAQDNDGSTPIMFAAQHGYSDLVELLINHGAKVNITGKHGLSAIGFAQQNGHKQTEKLLRRGMLQP